jgi:hypothetical protein
LFQDRPTSLRPADVQVGDDCDSSGDGVYVYWKTEATVAERDELLSWFSQRAGTHGWAHHQTLTASDLNLDETIAPSNYNETLDPDFLSMEYVKRVDRPEGTWSAHAFYSDHVFVVKLLADTECAR